MEKSVKDLNSELENIHVSLSKPFCLSLWEIDSVKDMLIRCVRGVVPFTMRLDGEDLVYLPPGGGGEELFVAMPVTSGKVQVSNLIDQVDVVLRGFGKPEYFTERVLHASVAKTTATPVDGLDDHLQIVSGIVFKAGHRQFAIPF
ncbi:hypothetical protein BASA81_006873 [Batrachochytrium salamandrivorans]|nr:hypothetical protein BASA81_006873 [Batrachochytrium salamandrivorans]